MSSNSIRLLPDSVANQIAAGEVVQRPSSAVKELLENAIDAGATQINLIIKDGGKSLIQVNDNGTGMNPFDARMSFERHATSKISGADDLFTLHTKGFRGEALASIAAVAQVEMKTRQADTEIGQYIIVEGSKLISQTECECAPGTSISVKNLFYNIPARRNFLKNDQIELRHIMDELERVALPHHDIQFIFQSNNNEVLNLHPGNLMQRIKSLMGNYIQKELVPIQEQTPYVKVNGLVSLPQFAIKTKKEQFLFINNRYIRNPFLNHAVYEAYRELISPQSHPKYFIFLEMDPKHIDINIHPTKTEIKFTDERTVYMILLSSLKRALGKANGVPSLDFETEPILAGVTFTSDKIPVAPKINYNADYNPFDSALQKNNRQNWEALYEGFKELPQGSATVGLETQHVLEQIKKETVDFEVFQWQLKYLVTGYNENIFIIDQQRAHERVLYEHYLRHGNEKHPSPSQKILFPEQLELSTGDFVLIKNLLPELQWLGFEIDVFGKNNIVINGTPGDLQGFDTRRVLEDVLESYKLNLLEYKLDKHENLCRSMAKNTSVKYGKKLEESEMKLLLRRLFECREPLYTAGGKIIMMEINYTDTDKFFKR